MADLTNVQIGSIVLNMIENVPTYISGTLLNLVNNEIYFAEQKTGDNIGTTVVDKYQPAIISLVASSVLKMMELQGVDASSISMGDFTISKGQGSSSLAVADKLREDGIEKLEVLGNKFTYYKALG